MIKMEQNLKDLINSAFKDRVICLVGTASKAGEPQISPKGSVCIYDDTTLAYWERAKRSSLARLQENENVVVYYWNPAKREEMGGSPALRFYGTAEIHEEGETREKVKALVAEVAQPELDRDEDGNGFAILIHLTSIETLGSTLQSADN